MRPDRPLSAGRSGRPPSARGGPFRRASSAHGWRVAWDILGRRAATATGLVGAAVLVVALLAGLVRVLPWIVAPTIPLRVVLPFARALFAASLETTLLCAPPLGWALASAWLVERGEARALFAIGQSPTRIVRSSVPVAFAFTALAGVAALAWGTEAAAPGRLARSLVDEAKRSCEGQTAPRAADVPFVGVTWLCFPPASSKPRAAGARPRLTGALPGGTGAFTAADVTVSDDLRSLQFLEMELLFGGAGNIRVHAGEARITGLSPWGRASNLPPAVRALLLSFTGTILAMLASWTVLASSVSRRLASLLVGGAGPAAAVLVLSHLEHARHGVAVYVAVPVVGLGGLALAVLAVRAGRLRRPAGKPVAPR
jgi:hypothetical protein